MKVVHVLKKIEAIDQDIKDLRKLEKSITKNKSFSTPIYMTIEKQINILLGDRIKMLELKIENPPENLLIEKQEKSYSEKPAPPENKSEKKSVIKKKASISKMDFDDEIPMLTQDDIDAKINSIQKEKKSTIKTKKNSEENSKSDSSDDIKILDIALEKGTVNSKEIEKERKVRFFRENFPEE